MSKPKQRKGKPNTRSKGNNGSKPSKSNDKDETIWRNGSEADSRSHGNPYELYSKNQLLIQNATKINTNNPLGVKVGLFTNAQWMNMVNDGIIGSGLTRWNMVPGVAVFEFVAGPGPSDRQTSPVNIAANALYSYIRHANSGAANYDSASLIMLMLAMDSAYIWYYTLVRLYGTMNLYSAENRYYPRTLVQAQGFDFESVKVNMNNLQFQINRFGKILNSLYIPKFNIFERHKWCVENYFLDDDSTKAQTYLLKPAGLHFLNESSSAGGQFGDLIYVPWADMGDGTRMYHDFDNIVAITERFADILQYSSDVAMISGDIKKAYGPEYCMSVPSITDNFDKLPVKDDMVLSMIHNTSIMDYSYVENTDFDIKQMTAPDGSYFYVLWDPLNHYAGRFPTSFTGKFLKEWNCAKRLVNYYIDDPDPSMVVESTRFTTISNGGANWMHGTEIVINQKIFFHSTATMAPTFISFKQISGNLGDLPHVSAFNSFPLQYRFTGSNTDQKITAYTIFGELENYTVLEYDQLAKLHEAAVLSEWDVPSINNYI